MPSRGGPRPPPRPGPSGTAPAVRRQHWGEAPDVTGFLGRGAERTLLRGWVLDPDCRVVAVLGIGGVGKTLLAARVARDVVPDVAGVYWRSLRDAPPPAEQLAGALGFLAPERRLVALLDQLRGRPVEERGYGPGNLVNLLRALRGELRWLALSALALRNAYLADVDAQDASLAGVNVTDVVFAEAHLFPTAVALSADGAYLTVGTATGE